MNDFKNIKVAVAGTGYVVVSLYTSRVILNALGVEDFGIL